LNKLIEKEDVEPAVGTLWASIQAATGHAIESGALCTIPTYSEIIDEGYMQFIVRRLLGGDENPELKSVQCKKGGGNGRPVNPFLPHEEDLFVADLSDTHLCILNKYNVQEDHLLIITRQFEEQEALLTLPDFTAMWRCLAEIDGLAFYNGGQAAGASQPHKHLQVVPLPLLPDAPPLTIDRLLQEENGRFGPGALEALPFIHSIAPASDLAALPPAEAATLTYDRYLNMLERVGLPVAEGNADWRQPGPYNLLVTRRWILLVPRSRHAHLSVSINALGYAGSLFVRNLEQYGTLRKHGPLAILTAVGMPL